MVSKGDRIIIGLILLFYFLPTIAGIIELMRYKDESEFRHI